MHDFLIFSLAFENQKISFQEALTDHIAGVKHETDAVRMCIRVQGKSFGDMVTLSHVELEQQDRRLISLHDALRDDCVTLLKTGELEHLCL